MPRFVNASPTAWHPIRPPSGRLERRPNSEGHAGVCLPSLAPARVRSRETLGSNARRAEMPHVAVVGGREAAPGDRRGCCRPV